MCMTDITGSWGDFGNTIFAVFTDEPHIDNGTTGILDEVNRILGYDFTPYLADLWYDDHENSAQLRAEYKRAISIRAEEHIMPR